MTTLKEKCFEVVVKNFEIFSFLYNTSKDVYVRRLLHFLQKMYGLPFVTAVFEEYDIQPSHLDLLIHEYLKELHTSWMMNISWRKIKKKISEIGTNIEKIFIHDIQLQSRIKVVNWEDIICYLPNLKNFISNGYCSDAILKNIAAYCPDIEEIDARHSPITDEGVRQLCLKQNGTISCSKLKKLFLHRTSVTDEGMKHIIQNLPSLEELDLHGLPEMLCYMHFRSLQILDKIPPYKFTSLKLAKFEDLAQFPTILKICLTLCPFLKELNCAVRNDEDLKIISTPKLISLKNLELFCCVNRDINVSNFFKSKGLLTCLSIHNCAISLTVLADCCPYLKQLSLDKINLLCDNDFKHTFFSLDSCSFEYSVNDSTAAKAVSLILSSSPKLQNVTFITCSMLILKIKTFILNCFQHSPIKSLDFRGCVFACNEDFIKNVLLNCNSLKTLHLYDCEFKVNEEEEIHRFAEILPNNPKIYFNSDMSM